MIGSGGGSGGGGREGNGDEGVGWMVMFYGKPRASFSVMTKPPVQKQKHRQFDNFDDDPQFHPFRVVPLSSWQ